jgi:preprotein translocase subunit YajC
MELVIKIFPYIAIILVFYFFMIKPKIDEGKKMREFNETLKIGVKVITIGGIHGKIAEISDVTVVIETMSGKLKLDRSAISIEKTAALNAVKK